MKTVKTIKDQQTQNNYIRIYIFYVSCLSFELLQTLELASDIIQRYLWKHGRDITSAENAYVSQKHNNTHENSNKHVIQQQGNNNRSSTLIILLLNYFS